VPASLATPSDSDTKRADIHWVYLSTVYFLLAGAAFYLYLARVLPPEELGAVVLMQAIATIVSVLVSLGLSYGFQHYLSFYRGRQVPRTVRLLVRSSLIATALLALVGLSITLALSGTFSVLLFHSAFYRGDLELLSLYAGLATAMTILQGVVLGLQRFRLFASRSLVTYTATYGGAILFLALWPGVRSIVLGWALGAGVGCLLYLGAMLGDRTPSGFPAGAVIEPTSMLHPGGPLYRALLLYSVPLLVSSVISTSATYVDRIVLASVASLSSLGFYNYALLIVGGSLVVASPFGTILLPRISEHLGRNDRAAIRALTRTSVTLIVLVYVPLALGIASLGPVLLRILVGPQFVQDSIPMAVLLALAAVAIPGTILGCLAAGTRRTGAVMRASALALGANAALSIILVPRIGILGAALGNSSMYWGPLLVLYLEMRPSGLVDVDFSSLARIWVASAAMALAMGLPMLILGFPTLLAPPIALFGVGVLLVSLRISRAVPSDASAFLLEMLPKWFGILRPMIKWVTTSDRSPTRPERFEAM
jgi:O-antigen/teichoic acid export membrane protein